LDAPTPTFRQRTGIDADAYRRLTERVAIELVAKLNPGWVA
jgi:hypothetical protein